MTETGKTGRKTGPKPEVLTEDDVLELLPWYTTGKTTAEETQAIERSLAASPRLQAELALARRERQAALSGAEAIGTPPAFIDGVLAQLDRVRQLPPLARDGGTTVGAIGSVLSRFFGFAPSPGLRLAAVAACLIIVIEGAAIVHLSGSGGSDVYQTASAPDATASGPHLIVRFQPDAGAGAVGNLLHDIDASITRGPMPDGSYVVALPQGADIDQAIAALKGHGDLVAGVDRGS